MTDKVYEEAYRGQDDVDYCHYSFNGKFGTNFQFDDAGTYDDNKILEFDDKIFAKMQDMVVYDNDEIQTKQISEADSKNFVLRELESIFKVDKSWLEKTLNNVNYFELANDYSKFLLFVEQFRVDVDKLKIGKQDVRFSPLSLNAQIPLAHDTYMQLLGQRNINYVGFDDQILPHLFEYKEENYYNNYSSITNYDSEGPTIYYNNNCGYSDPLYQNTLTYCDMLVFTMIAFMDECRKMNWNNDDKHIQKFKDQVVIELNKMPKSMIFQHNTFSNRAYIIIHHWWLYSGDLTLDNFKILMILLFDQDFIIFAGVKGRHWFREQLKQKLLDHNLCVTIIDDVIDAKGYGSRIVGIKQQHHLWFLNDIKVILTLFYFVLDSLRRIQKIGTQALHHELHVATTTVDLSLYIFHIVYGQCVWSKSVLELPKKFYSKNKCELIVMINSYEHHFYVFNMVLTKKFRKLYEYKNSTFILKKLLFLLIVDLSRRMGYIIKHVEREDCIYIIIKRTDAAVIKPHFLYKVGGLVKSVIPFLLFNNNNSHSALSYYRLIRILQQSRIKVTGNCSFKKHNYYHKNDYSMRQYVNKLEPELQKIDEIERKMKLKHYGVDDDLQIINMNKDVLNVQSFESGSHQSVYDIKATYCEKQIFCNHQPNKLCNNCLRFISCGVKSYPQYEQSNGESVILDKIEPWNEDWSQPIVLNAKDITVQRGSDNNM